MESLVSLIKKAKNNDRSAMQNILTLFKPKLEKCLNQTSYQEREDLKQEVNMKIVAAILRYNLDTTPSFWDLIKCEIFDESTNYEGEQAVIAGSEPGDTQ